jgi:hypothetical protein
MIKYNFDKKNYRREGNITTFPLKKVIFQLLRINNYLHILIITTTIIFLK